MRVDMRVCVRTQHTCVYVCTSVGGCWPPQQEGAGTGGESQGRAAGRQRWKVGGSWWELRTVEHFLVPGKRHPPRLPSWVTSRVLWRTVSPHSEGTWFLTVKPIREVFCERALLKEGEIWVNRSPARPPGVVHGGWSPAGGTRGQLRPALDGPRCWPRSGP